MHPSLTPERVIEAARADDGRGFCVACGDETDGVEGDARNLPCPTCGLSAVRGAEDLALEIVS